MGKKISKFSFLGLSLVAAIGFAGCSGSADSSDNKDNNLFDMTYTLQGYVYDATTGARLGDDDSFEMYLVQETNHRTPSKLVTDANSLLLGEYAFTDIPLDLYAGNKVFKLVVGQDGYQTFEALISYDATDCNADFGDDGYEDCNDTLDTEYVKMGDVALFPLAATAPDYQVIVQYDGELVEGATVQLDPCNDTNVETTSTASNLLAQYNESLESLVGTTDSAGSVTFAGSTLVLGGCYDVEVLPVTYETVQLAKEAGSQIIVGVSDQAQVVAMGDLEPGNDDDGLYVVSFTPLDSDDVVSSGALVLTFNRPVELLNPDTQITAALNRGASVDVSGTPAQLEDQEVDGGSVNESLSEDGLTLTLTPNYNEGDEPVTDPDDSDYDSGLRIAYSGTIYLLDDESYVPISLAALEYSSGDLVSELDADLDATNNTIMVNILTVCDGCDADD